MSPTNQPVHLDILGADARPAAVFAASGQGRNSPVPPEIKRWNWGAMLLSWIWGLGNGVYVSLLALVPFLGFIMVFVLGAKGNEWAWQRGKWPDVETFRRSQRNWGIAGLLVWVGLTALALVGMLLVGSAVRQSGTGQPTAVVSSDGRFSLRIPGSWSALDDLNDEATIQAGDEFGAEFAIVIVDDKRDLAVDGLREFSELTRGLLAESFDSGGTTRNSRVVRAGRLWGLQHEIRASVDGINVVYLHTVFRGRGSYAQVVAWTVPSRFDAAKARLNDVVKSFRILKS
ncbi:MAG TPA: hypothetical protein VGB83_06220 [Actinomycetota bacterium]